MLTAQRVAMVFNDTQLCGRPKIYMNICHQRILEYLFSSGVCVYIYRKSPAGSHVAYR